MRAAEIVIELLWKGTVNSGPLETAIKSDEIADLINNEGRSIHPSDLMEFALGNKTRIVRSSLWASAVRLAAQEKRSRGRVGLVVPQMTNCSTYN